MRLPFSPVLIVGLLVAAQPASAGNDVWTPVGPDGGAILALAIDPASSSTLYVGSFWDGLYKSVDGGATWAPSNSGLSNASHIAVAVSPHDSSVVLAANRLRQLFKSTDGGATWALSSGGVSAASSGTIKAKILFDPSDANIVYWASPGGEAAESLLKSTDGGANWSPVAGGLPSRIDDFFLDPTTPSTLFADVGSDGVYRSTTGGASWQARNTGLPLDGGGRPAVWALALDTAAPQTLYASSRADGKIYKTTDAGGNWTAAAATDHDIYALWVHPTNGKLYGVKVDTEGADPSRRISLFVSADAGATWTLISAGHFIWTERLVFDPASALTLFAALSEGLYKTTDGGATWTAASSGLRGMRVASLAFSPSSPSTYYFGGENGIFRTTDGGATFAPINDGLAQPKGEELVVDPTDPQTVLAGAFTADSVFVTDAWPPPDSGVTRSTDGGTTWVGVPNPAFATGWYGLGQAWGLAWDPTSASTVYAASPGGNYPSSGDLSVWRSTDSGASFQAASVGLPEGFGFCNSLAAAPTLPQTTVYLGCSGFSFPDLHRSTDGAATWSDVSTGTTLEGTRPRSVLVHPTTPSTVFVGTREGIFKSTDSGLTWAASSSGLPSMSLVNSVVAHAAAPDTIYAAVYDGETRQGAPYWSRDGGATWQRLAFGMENVYVWVLAIDPGNANHVVAGTEQSLWEITVDPNLATCDPPDLSVSFPPDADPASYVTGCDVQINGVILESDPACPIDRVLWRWGDGFENTSWFPAAHTYARNGGSTSVTVIGYDTLGNYSAATGDLNLWDCLVAGACGYPDNRTLANLTFDTPETVQACQAIDVGPEFAVVSPGGDVTLRAGESVTFSDGVSIDSDARAKVEIDPLLQP